MGVKQAEDKFYTKPSVAIEMMKNVNFSSYDCVIEPSAGSGAFSNNIKHKGLIALDLKPESAKIQQADWFEYNIDQSHKDVLVIGNPPFGIKNDLSKGFIKHAISFDNVKTVAMVLPNVFNKHTLQSVFPDNWSLARAVELEDNSFTLEGEDYHVPCTFYIWTKREVVKDYRVNPDDYKSHPDFRFCKQDEADFYVMGAAPKVVKDVEDVEPNNRGYYIKSNINKKQLRKNFKTIDWDSKGNSSVNGGVSWRTKYELVKVYSELAPI